MQTISPVKITPKVVAPKRAPLKWFVVFIVSTIAVVGLLEGIFAWAGIGEQECLKIDPYLGFSPFPNKKVTWRKEGFSRTYYNQFGMQDHDYTIAKPKHTKRIAMIGDSYIEALQVDRKDNFVSLLEKQLNSASRNDHWQVMNFGVQAHNLSQTYLNLKKLVLQFEPDIVILPIRPNASFLLPPDLETGFLSARPNFFVGAEGELIEDRTVQNIWLQKRAAKRMQNTAFLREHSHIWGVIATGIEAWANWKKSGGLLAAYQNSANTHSNALSWTAPQTEESEDNLRNQKQFTVNTKVQDDSIEFVWPIADALIKDMKQLCNAKDCQFAVVRLPGVEGHLSPVETNLVKRTTKSYGIPYLDLTEPFKKALVSRDKKLFYSTHFTEAGHLIVTKHLSRFLAREDFDHLRKTDPN